MERKTIAVAGASGKLGLRVVRALLERDVSVKAFVRDSTMPAKVQQLRTAGAEVVIADFRNLNETASQLSGASCVVSTLLGLRDVIVESQSELLNAAVHARVPRFIPSDYSIDFTKVAPGGNRNLDLHREFHRRLDVAEICSTTIFNGAFMDLLKGEAPMIQRSINCVIYWGSAEQLLDFTTMDDTAEFTAAAAIDDDTPRFLRVAGEVTCARDIAETMSRITGKKFHLIRAGSLNSLRIMSKVVRALTPPSDEPFPAWQGMQYFYDMFDGQGKLNPLDNGRYPELRWTRLSEFL